MTGDKRNDELMLLKKINALKYERYELGKGYDS